MVIKQYCTRVNLRLQPPGRAKQSLIGTRAAARERGDEALVRICDYGLEAIDRYVDLRARRGVQRIARSDGEARVLDRAVDNFIGDIKRALERAPGRYPHHPERHRQAADLDAKFFPDGANAITNLPYEEELIVAEYLHHHMTTDHPEWCVALRIDGLLADLGEILPAYREALTPDDLITIDDVNGAFDQIQHALCAAVSHVMGRFWRVEDAEARDALLRAIFDQDRRLGELIAARRRSGSGGPALDVPVAAGDGVEQAVDVGDAVADLDDPADAAPAADAPDPAVEGAPEGDGTLRPLPIG